MGGPPLVMAGKDGKVEPKSGDVVRQGFMVKRSQNKKRFTPVNYKQRWFVLTRRHLVYYDGDGERRKERGRIAVESVHVVETASLGSNAGAVGGVGGVGGAGGVGGVGGVGGDVAGNEAVTGAGGGGIPPGLPFQVGYREAGQEYTLYLLAAREQDRAEWIRAIRAVCSENPGLSGRYHAGLWSGKRWSCCRVSTRSAEGCDTCSSWSSKPLNTTNSSSTSTSNSTSAPGSTNATCTTAATTDRPQTTNSETNNNPIVHSQTRSTIDKPVEMHGHNNYYAAQQIFYINPQQQLKQQINAARIDEVTKKDYIVSSGIGAHKLHLRKLTWNKARKACIDEGGHLAVINSKEEEKILLRMLNQENVAWLGVHDIFEEGEWVTVLDEALENTGYSRWTTIYANEPDNYGGKQNCAVLVKQGGMDDLDCGAMCPYICEISIT